MCTVALLNITINPVDGDVGMAMTFKQFREKLHNEKRIALNAFPMRHYYGMMTIEVVESTDESEGGYNVWSVPVGGVKSLDAFYKFSEWESFELDVLRKMHPEFICACSNQNECFSNDCPVKPA